MESQFVPHTGQSAPNKNQRSLKVGCGSDCCL